MGDSCRFDNRRFGRKHAVVCEPVIQKPLCRGKAQLACRAAQHHRDKRHTVPCGGAGKAVARLGGEPGFHARCALVKADKLVCVCQSEGAVADSIHPDPGKPENKLMLHQLTRDNGDIQRAAVMPLRGQPVRVHEIAVFAAQLGGAGVHRGNKRILAPVYVFAQRDRRIVCRNDDKRLQQVMHRHPLARFQKHLRAAHRCRAFAHRHLIFERYFAAVQRLRDQKRAYDLCHGCDRKVRRLVFRKKHAPGGKLHQQQRLCIAVRNIFRNGGHIYPPELIRHRIIRVHRPDLRRRSARRHGYRQHAQRRTQYPFHFDHLPSHSMLCRRQICFYCTRSSCNRFAVSSPRPI